MILASYKYLPSQTDADMQIKKLAKHLMEKYMKSAAQTTEEEIMAFKTLMDTIEEKSKEL